MGGITTGTRGGGSAARRASSGSESEIAEGGGAPAVTGSAGTPPLGCEETAAKVLSGSESVITGSVETSPAAIKALSETEAGIAEGSTRASARGWDSPGIEEECETSSSKRVTVEA